MPTMNQPHGFAWPAGLPECQTCGRPAASSIHVNPAKGRNGITEDVMVSPMRDPLPPVRAGLDKRKPHLPDRAHAYVPGSVTVSQQVRCAACGQTMSSGNHPTGMPAMTDGMPMSPSDPGVQQVAFVAEVGRKIVVAAPGRATSALSTLPPQLASAFQGRTNDRSGNLWVAGRYVEADRPNRNMAYWTTPDLEMGMPSVTHGPVNWLHEERHVIGTIADARLIAAQRQAADASDVGNHIVALAAVWPWLYPQEARVMAAASDKGRLYFSMECVSREVACLEDGCGHGMTYRNYMTEKASRCDHMKGGRPRRFVDPVFMGAGMIVPPVEPGWARADATILKRAEAQVEKQAAAFTGLTEAEATGMVATIMRNA